VCTAELDSGIQISGVIAAYRLDPKSGTPAYLRCQGPTQLAHRDEEIESQGPDYHREGFSTVIGRVQGLAKSPAALSDAELAKLTSAGTTSLRFESGIEVVGKIGTPVRRDGKILILPFTDCTVTWKTGGKEEVLFQPEWGTFDLACGESVTSVFGGAADRKNYLAKTGGFKQLPMAPKCNLTSENRALNELYARVRELREKKIEDRALEGALTKVEAALEAQYPEDWLLRLELLELFGDRASAAPVAARLRKRLAEISKLSKDREEMITRGLALVGDPK
jgi:phenylalanine-4-hydroxylase